MTDELPAPEPPARRARWRNVACCERCWIERNSTWAPHSGSAGLEQLVSIRQPTTMTNPPIEICGFCFSTTIIGIYVRTNEVRNPMEVENPVLTEDEWNAFKEATE